MLLACPFCIWGWRRSMEKQHSIVKQYMASLVFSNQKKQIILLSTAESLSTPTPTPPPSPNTNNLQGESWPKFPAVHLMVGHVSFSQQTSRLKSHCTSVARSLGCVGISLNLRSDHRISSPRGSEKKEREWLDQRRKLRTKTPNQPCQFTCWEVLWKCGSPTVISRTVPCTGIE